jgi:hypothetical protein
MDMVFQGDRSVHEDIAQEQGRIQKLSFACPDSNSRALVMMQRAP